jgi:hypothetical protein
MRKQACWHRITPHLAVALTLAALLVIMSPSPASAQDLSEYFNLSYDPVTFDKSEIHSGEVFHATIVGRATCTKALPVPISEASVTSQVFAIHATSGTMVMLNSSYTITIKPFPSKENLTAEINQSVPLQFPIEAEPGDYSVVAKIVKAEVKIFVPVPVTSYLPQEQVLGAVKYIASGPATPPASTNAETPPSPAPPPSSPPVNPVPPTQPPRQITSGWFWPAVLLAAATLVFGVSWFLRHRHPNTGSR